MVCGLVRVMVNISDVAAMGGTPVAVVDAMWADGTASAQEILAGMRAAAERFGVPIVGGHTNLNSRCRQLSVAILGKAKRLLTSFDAKPGERLVAAVDLRGRYRAHFSNWEAATDAPGSRLRGDLALLPTIAEARLSKAAKDISQGGIVGTAAMLAECSNVGVAIDLGAIPQPSGVPLERWLKNLPKLWLPTCRRARECLECYAALPRPRYCGRRYRRLRREHVRQNHRRRGGRDDLGFFATGVAGVARHPRCRHERRPAAARRASDAFHKSARRCRSYPGACGRAHASRPSRDGFCSDATRQGFFRPALCNTRCIPVAPSRPGVLAMVEQRVADYLDYFSTTQDDFDVWHAQDGISGNVLATLKAQGRIAGFVRTVHHVDDFADARLAALQRRSIEAADVLLTVSGLWRDWLRNTWKRDAEVVGNGVDSARFSPIPDGSDIALRGRLGLVSNAPIFLAVGGVEERKNTLRILEAFKLLLAQHPAARLVVAGGASLLDHSAYQIPLFRGSCRERPARVRGDPNRSTAPGLDAALYRTSTALVFPSVKEGFGLVVLEAMASGTPAIVSCMAPFTEYLTDSDVLWCEPSQPTSIADAMQGALHPDRHERFRRLGIKRAAQFDWSPSRGSASRPIRPHKRDMQCLKCGSTFAGPMAPSRAATRPRW